MRLRKPAMLVVANHVAREKSVGFRMMLFMGSFRAPWYSDACFQIFDQGLRYPTWKCIVFWSPFCARLGQTSDSAVHRFCDPLVNCPAAALSKLLPDLTHPSSGSLLQEIKTSAPSLHQHASCAIAEGSVFAARLFAV